MRRSAVTRASNPAYPRAGLPYHRGSETMPDAYVCPQCGAQLLSDEDLQRHLREEHPAGVLLDDEQELIDEEGRESFPASDPPARTPVEGTGAPPPARPPAA